MNKTFCTDENYEQVEAFVRRNTLTFLRRETTDEKKALAKDSHNTIGKSAHSLGSRKNCAVIIGEPENEPISNLANILTVSATPLRCPTAKK
ncbi:MAG: hypothetical protein GX218_00455 [Clostridiaceae bacterium]|nr:hypothetical protein [Clostridiaceae bacterium]